MIKSIKIENFQAHKELELDFSKFITTITGPSDRGKSAIIRALVWVITNRPSGDDFIRYGADECRVTVEVDSHIVQRVKGKKRNIYILDGVEFKALKTDVPEQIQKVLNITPNNIQGQFDPIFWFSSTAGEVGRNLNQIVNLDIIDFVLGEIQSKTRQTKTTIEVLDNMVVEQENILTGAQQIKDIQEIIDRINKLNDKFIGLRVQSGSLKADIDSVLYLSGWLARAQKWEETYRQLELALDQYIETLQTVSSMRDVIGDVSKLQGIIAQDEVPDNLYVLIDKIEDRQEEITGLRKQWKKLHGLLTEIEDAEQTVQTQTKAAKQAEQEFHRVIDGNVCPLCGRGGEK